MSSNENDLIKAEAARYKRATDAAAKSRATLTELVIDALREPGAKPADIARRADWTAAYVRKLARENGIQADPAYQARTEKARARLLAEAGATQASARPEPREQPGALEPLSPADVALKHVGDLTPRQLAGLSERAFQKVNKPRQFDLLNNAAETGGDRAVVEAALVEKLLTAVDLQVAE